jgi:glycosyltransferase involved in cell wall biosynthesis
MPEKDCSKFAALRMTASANEQRPELSIIIRTKNEECSIGRTLSAVFQQGIDLPFEVIVIDSGSTDRTLDIVRRHTVSVYEIEAREFSYGRALNFGSSIASGQYLVNLSAHCIPTNIHWLANLVKDLRDDSRIAATYGGQIPMKGMNPFEEHLLMTTFAPDDQGKIGPPFSNSNCALRKEVWERHPFDEAASFAEDFIWSQTLPNNLKIKFVPEAAVFHSHPLQLGYWAKRSYDNGVFVQYLEHVYGLQYRWNANKTEIGPDEPGWKDFFRAAGRHVDRFVNIFMFLIENKYFKFLPVLPVYVAMQQFYYRKGLADGRKLYAGFKEPVT